MTPEVPPVTVTPPARPAAAPAPPPAAPPPDSAAQLAAEKTRTAQLEAQVAEHQRNAQFWFEKANKGAGKPSAEAAPVAEPEVDLLDVITTKGAKGLTEYLKQQGMVTRDEATSLVNSKAAQIAKEGELMATYPDLQDKGSDFFKATAAEYGELKRQGVSETLAMELAAQRVDLRFLREGKTKTPAQHAADEKAQRELDRAARAAAGGGDRGRRAPEGNDDDDTLSENDEAAVRQLAEGLDIPLDKARERYIARAKAGVHVALKLDRGRNR
jgi:hypothetical protein